MDKLRHSRLIMMQQWRHTAYFSAVHSFGRRRVISACIALILLALQVFGSALASPPVVFDPDRVGICTENGFMILGHDGQPEKAPRADHNGHCTFCLRLLHTGAPPAAQGIFVRFHPPEDAGFKVLAAPSAVAGIAPLAGAASPQAPPVPV